MSGLFDLSGQVAIVTGSSRGIGRAIGEAFAQHGAKVVISSRNQSSCDEVAHAINDRAGQEVAIAISANISSKQALESLVDQTLAKWGHIDCLVANAASNPHFGPMSSLPDDAFLKILQNNVISNHWLAQMVAPQMKARKSGSIIIISSIGGLKGSDMIGAYDISKAADMQLARNLALELGRDNIRVNTIAPGLIRTDFAKALWENPNILQAYTSKQCLHRIGEPEEIAGMAILLASRAGSFATGQTFVVDGGATAV